MKALPHLPYLLHERAHLEKLKQLFEDWHTCFVHGASELDKHVADDIVCDGFYPYYFSQKRRILFVGRESRHISGFNYLEILFKCYRETKRIGDQHLNVSKFHSRMFYLAYGILNGIPDWQAIPDADKIGDNFGMPEGISFAFMNVSKLSNEADEWQSDWSAIAAAHCLSSGGRSFNEEEVAILKPEIVITMNLGDKLASLGRIEKIDTSNSVTTWWLESAGHRSLLIDTFHFSAWNKNDITDFYLPVCKTISKYLP